MVLGIREYSDFILLHVAGPVFPAPFIEEIVLSPIYVLVSLIDHSYVGLFLGFFFILLH